ncbi:PREDICTED: zinc-finger homeodomain protein 14 [Theobroma cacao]|uniref:Zinc-finger homeodomain protein 14 n=1 Tax=Theobroma cacao TaxID=3641 RepID=A0AB32VKL8_THECC|nr:PREDICTED: zinc-finger homeodomain protein 14 [Theobroma cacao]
MEKETYRDCQRNHACYLGGYAIDGCSEFIPSNNKESHCKACGCHRNYHRKVPFIYSKESPEIGHRSGKSFWSLREAKRIARQHRVLPAPSPQVLVRKQQNSNRKFKQRKSKFTGGQREAMRALAETLGWTMRNKGRQTEINRFCGRIGVSRLHFKTWLNNNKKLYFKGTASMSGANSSSSKAV